MKIYFLDKETNEKRYLPYSALSRSHLKEITGWNSGYFSFNGVIYHISDVKSEKNNDQSIIIGAFIGAFLGLMVGLIGLIIGAALGTGVSINESINDEIKVECFNCS